MQAALLVLPADLNVSVPSSQATYTHNSMGSKAFEMFLFYFFIHYSTHKPMHLKTQHSMLSWCVLYVCLSPPPPKISSNTQPLLL